MGFTYSMFVLSFAVEPVVGALQLQEPAHEYYYSRESGTVEYGYDLRQGDKVVKGQVLLTYSKGEDKKSRNITSRTAGYLEYINNQLSVGASFSTGEMLYKVQSDLVLGWYFIDDIYKKKLQQSAQLWACSESGYWQFNIDVVKPKKLLVSLTLASSDYSALYQLSLKPDLTMYPSKQACLDAIL
ncbi:hypothetical protein PSECIP111951_02881 [Pseudoalteromonas holothuriae]|uniref:Uncharacterized protein n=1 Tax=Pseudoalteromonas holothuriae TaxID=2963714 RepID=A0A9W4VSI9_9GAMM|nr:MULTISPECIES: hypothetical protein [unclassified Pseudoalteromonas]CAH9060138.1 hypothetical protein PSECIP111854_02545 [Pseudoalteromonas sp. CIP111854]CAH9063328.1 hypothetical protein PSECIP111951_02881 [Pseudoalteromonas sp. CIP111951]